jgi:hypothetical protein
MLETKSGIVMLYTVSSTLYDTGDMLDDEVTVNVKHGLTTVRSKLIVAYRVDVKTPKTSIVYDPASLVSADEIVNYLLLGSNVIKLGSDETKGEVMDAVYTNEAVHVLSVAVKAVKVIYLSEEPIV